MSSANLLRVHPGKNLKLDTAGNHQGANLTLRTQTHLEETVRVQGSSQIPKEKHQHISEAAVRSTKNRHMQYFATTLRRLQKSSEGHR